MLVVVEPDVEAQLRRVAIERLPEELCGILARTGCSDEIRLVGFTPLPNIASDPSRSFAVDPVDFARAEAGFRRAGLALGAIFHTHPDVAARPSRADAEVAWPGVVHLVLAVDSKAAPAPRTGDLTAWTLLGTGFRRLPTGSSRARPA